MYLEDILRQQDAPLLEDDYSGTSLGLNNHLTVLGWCGRKRTHKLYVVCCEVCKEDSEMYGDGHFTSEKYDLNFGKIPCGCSPHSWKTKEQWGILATRRAVEIGYTFCGWLGEFKGNETKCTFNCELHGEWSTSILSQLLTSSTVSCPSCRAIEVGLQRRKPDDEMISSFMVTGSYIEGTSFTRSDKLNKRGHKRRWLVNCPLCDITYDSDYNSLQKGLIGCQCGTQFHNECYINLVSDESTPICLKFGVSKDSERRLKEQNRASVMGVTSLGVWQFKDKETCLLVENKCMESMVCGVVTPNELPDGFTETTYLHNLDKIISIYESNGGVRMNV